MSVAEEANWQLLTQYTLWLHIGLIFAFLFIIIYNYYILHKEKNFIRLAKILKRNMIFHHSFNFSVLYTGGVMLGIIKHFNFEIILMFLTSFYLFFGEFSRHFRQRIIKSNEKEKQNDYIIFAKRLYTTQIILLTSMFVFAKVF
jgi:hypothetical protein